MLVRLCLCICSSPVEHSGDAGSCIERRVAHRGSVDAPVGAHKSLQAAAEAVLQVLPVVQVRGGL